MRRAFLLQIFNWILAFARKEEHQKKKEHQKKEEQDGVDCILL
ncbi:MAG: hypothetical protein NZ927_01440 [Candidatus Calescibacterium sp.]|nr:hypothetical protein [Candidatus Calescibacterium sp.]MCX7733626.1 hypothetical protein [bacterium]MDW8087189.1 hypothetical protein [Candidatus Calescibacterium sp.]